MTCCSPGWVATTDGGFYTYVSLGLGRRLGAGAGWLAVLTYVTIAAGLRGAVEAARDRVVKNPLDTQR